jgi:hypothetical protein
MSRSIAALAGVVCALAPAVLPAQQIALSTELPRTLVFIQEKGETGVAARELMAFLRDARFR